MRLIIVIMTTCLLQVSASSFGQRISLIEKDAPLEQVLQKIKAQTNIKILYADYLMKNAKRVTLKISNAPLPEVLNKIFEDQPLSFELKENTLFITKRDPTFLERVAATLRTIDIRSRIVDDKGNALPGASVRVKGTNKVTITDANGEFTFNSINEDAVILISYLGFKVKEMSAKEVNSSSAIKMELVAGELAEVNVELNTGYQTLNKERATGSFVHIDNKLLNRSFSTDILSRLDGVASGVIFNKLANRRGFSGNGGDPAISIRGRSTINANTEPLVVLDNFPYDGDLNNINPNDVESVTILKDAAAASIWGVRASNGVIVITSKKGKYGQAAKVGLTSNLTVTGKPDLYAVPQLSSSQYIDVETRLFDLGYYKSSLKYSPTRVQSSVVDILDKRDRKLISVEQVQAQLDALREIDARDDYSKYFLQHAINQQYALNVSGGGTNNQYYISGGFDRNRSNNVQEAVYSKLNLNAGNAFRLLKDKLELTTSVMLTRSRTVSDLDKYNIWKPYEQLLDTSGNALVVNRGYRQEIKANAGNGLLLDWNYRPLDEIGNCGNSTTMTDYRLNLGLNYKIMNGFRAELSYQYANGRSDREFLYNKNSYYVRDLINKFSQIQNGKATRILPVGDILDGAVSGYQGHNGRAQLSYNARLGDEHEVNAIVGTEIRDYSSFYRSFPTLYGYNNETGSYTIVDYLKEYPQFFGGTTQITGGESRISGTADRFLSFYANASYTYKDRYTVSGSARKDESNLFGVDANKKGVPLWSAGLSWNISKESFYTFEILPALKFRATYGYNGNLSKELSAYVTAQFTYLNNLYGAPTYEIINPPNPSLSWERVMNLNLGIDFGGINNVFSGSIEYFRKKGVDLIGDAPLALQTGVAKFRGNTASVLTRGLELTLNSINTRGALKWQTNLLLNYVRDKVLAYKIQDASNNIRIYENYKQPLIGKPYSAVFSNKWGGLDGAGKPQGYLNDQLSQDYGAIGRSIDASQLVYHGSASPTVFGSLRNSFSWQELDLSFNITWKLGYYFRRESYNFRDNYRQADYEKRWQKPGDEATTYVPAELYPDNGAYMFFNYSSVLVEKGDHIRLQDIQAGYTLNKSKFKRLPFNQLRLNVNISNLNLIFWRANRQGLDPDYRSSIPTPRTWSIGLTTNF